MENTTADKLDTATNISICQLPHPDEIFERLAPQISIIDKSMSPIFYVIGLMANPITTKIWLSRHMRKNNSSAIYVGILSIVHTVFLLLHIILELNYAWNIPLYNIPVLCECFNMLIMIPQYYTPLLVLAFTIERYIAVNHPFAKERFCTVKRAIYVSIGLGVFSIQLASIQTYLWVFDRNSNMCNGRSIVEGGISQFEKIWVWTTEIVLFLFVPVCVIFFNILVIKEIRRITTKSPLPTQTRGSGSQTSTITLLSVSFYLFFTLFPATIVYSLQAIIQFGPCGNYDFMANDPTWQTYFSYMTIRKIIEEVCLSNYACYFFIYCVTGDHFRSEVKKLFPMKLWKAKGEESIQSKGGRSEYTLVTDNGQMDKRATPL